MDTIFKKGDRVKRESEYYAAGLLSGVIGIVKKSTGYETLVEYTSKDGSREEWWCFTDTLIKAGVISLGGERDE